MASEAPIRVATVNDYELVVAGVAALLSRFPDRFTVVDALIAGQPIEEPVDVALFDTFGRVRPANEALAWLCGHDMVDKVAVFSLSLAPEAVEEGRALGVAGFISKALSGDEIADAIEAIAAGKEVVAGPRDTETVGEILEWPGRAEGLSQRESEVLVMMARGYTNAEIASALFIGTETVKTHVRRVLTKLGLRNRSQAGSYVERSSLLRAGERAQRHAHRLTDRDDHRAATVLTAWAGWRPALASGRAAATTSRRPARGRARPVRNRRTRGRTSCSSRPTTCGPTSSSTCRGRAVSSSTRGRRSPRAG